MLYYYGIKDLDTLQSPEARGESKPTPKGYGVFDGGKSLTFYMQRIPKNIIDLTGGKFGYYRRRKVTTCYSVGIEAIPEDVAFRFRWSHRSIQLAIHGQDPVRALENKELYEQYQKELMSLEKRLGYRGQGKDLLIDQLQSHLEHGLQIEDAIKDLVGYDRVYPELKIFEKSNLFIPHVVLYLQNNESLPIVRSNTVFFKQ